MFAQSLAFYGPAVFSNPYVFPPICLILKVFKYLNSLKLPYTLVVPDVIPRRGLCFSLHALPAPC